MHEGPEGARNFHSILFDTTTTHRTSSTLGHNELARLELSLSATIQGEKHTTHKTPSRRRRVASSSALTMSGTYGLPRHGCARYPFHCGWRQQQA